MKPPPPAAFLCLALLAFSTAFQCAGENFLVDAWDIERGLPDSTVTGVMQAPDGYLWISTLSGLARFDGLRFVCFGGPSSAGLKAGDLNNIAVAGSGEVWALSADGALVFGDKSGFTTLKQPGAGDTVRSLQTDNAGTVWATLASGAMARCSAAKVQVIPHSRSFGGLRGPPVEFPDGSAWLVTSNGRLLQYKVGQVIELHLPGAPHQPLVGVSADGSGSVWVLGQKEIWQWRDQQWTPVALPEKSGEPFLGLKMGRDGDVWVWSTEGIWRLKHGEWMRANDSWPPVAGRFDPSSQLVDSEGRAWFGTLGQGLISVNAQGKVTVLSVEQGLPSNYILCLALDGEGNVWAGTQRGLVRIKPKRLAVISWEETRAEKQATGLAEDADGRLWIGSYGDGLFYQDARTSPFQAIRAFSLPKFCRALVFDHQNRLWLGTWREGLWVVENNQLKPVLEAELPEGQARSLLADSRGRLWIGTTKGLFSWVDGKLTPHPAPSSLGAIDARSMLENKDGSLWVGTERQGLLLWQNEVWQTNPLALPESLFSVWSLYQDGDGSLWIGTQGGGLARWRAGRLDMFNRANGLDATTICAILEDNRDNLWLGTYMGVYCLKKSECDAVAAGHLNTLEPEAFDRGDGMPTLQCSGSFQPAACRTSDGRLCFPTVKGVVVFDPRLETSLTPAPPVVIEEVVLGQRSLLPETGLRLGPRPKHIAFRYTALEFAAPEKVRFRYRLKGEDPDWIAAGTDRSAVFDTLPPGHHEFEVTACGAGGIWNEHGASLAFTVVPIWWETWWFQGGVACGALALAGVVLRQVLTRRLRQRLELARRQGAMDRERSRIARDIHDELGTSLTRIMMLSQPDDDENGHSDQNLSLSRIHQTAVTLTSAMDEVVWAVNPRQDTLEGLVSYVSVFAQEFISSANLVCRLDLPDSVPLRPLSAEVRHSIFLAVKEAINNAVRHARAREIRIALRTDQRGFTLEVADDGIGLDPARMARLDAAPSNGHGGHGLRNIRERLAAVDGRCDIEVGPKKGTLVRFVVPWRSPISCSENLPI